MKQCQIIEDDPRTAAEIEQIIQRGFPELLVRPIISTAKVAKEVLSSDPPDLLITDINLGEEQIFTVLEEIPLGRYPIIFITAYSKHAVRAFKFSALEFIEKPFSEEDLVSAVKQALNKIEAEDYNQMLQTFFENFRSQDSFGRLVIKNVDAVHIIPIENIEYLKSDNNYTEVFIDDGRKIVVAKPLKYYEKQLVQQGFFRTHQSYLANLPHAKTFHRKDSTLELNSGNHIAVSGSRAAGLIDRLIAP